MSFSGRGASYPVRTPIDALSDEELAARIAMTPSEEACTELYNRYKQRIYLWCYNYTHETEEAVDLAQEIFIKLFKNIGRFAGLARFSTWAYQVTRNHCLSELSTKRRKWWKRMISIEGDEMLQIADEDAFGSLEAQGDLERIIDAAKNAMTDQELYAFVLHYREGLTVREITALLHCDNVTGARTLIQNARRKFKRLTDERGFRDER
jgi:RNA polymerase sigma-70 factor (ECF subfamily)